MRRLLPFGDRNTSPRRVFAGTCWRGACIEVDMVADTFGVWCNRVCMACDAA